MKFYKHKEDPSIFGGSRLVSYFPILEYNYYIQTYLKYSSCIEYSQYFDIFLDAHIKTHKTTTKENGPR